MLTEVPRDLWSFARENGYDPSPCPDCTTSGKHTAGCANCGGSGRLWTSPRGSLSDDGLLRLQRLLDFTP